MKKREFTNFKYAISGIEHDLEELEKLNGQVRKVSIVIEDSMNSKGDNPAYYGGVVDEIKKYHFSDGDGKILSGAKHNRKYRKSVRKIAEVNMSGKKARRKQKELDDLAVTMARSAVRNVKNFIKSGANEVYQPWKGTYEENLMVTGALYNSIKGKASHNDKELFKGRW